MAKRSKTTNIWLRSAKGERLLAGIIPRVVKPAPVVTLGEWVFYLHEYNTEENRIEYRVVEVMALDINSFVPETFKGS